jgi:hypothetical protein
LLYQKFAKELTPDYYTPARTGGGGKADYIEAETCFIAPLVCLPRLRSL